MPLNSGGSLELIIPVDSPAFTGNPTVPTQPAGTNNDTVATTAFVQSAVVASTTGVSSVATLTGAVTVAELVTAGLAPLASPTFTGTPTVPGYLTTSAAASTYAPLASPTFTGTPTVPTYLKATLAASTYAPIASPTFTGTVTLPSGAVIPGYAPLASPTFSGTVSVPTAAPGTNTTEAASTAFVTNAVAASTTGVSSILGNTGAITLAELESGGVAPLASPTFTGTPTVPGYATTASLASYAPLASPALTGTPTVPTATAGTNTTQAASTAFVHTATSALVTGVSAVAGLTGAPTLAQLVGAGLAPLASPTFTGTPTVPGYATTASLASYAPLASPALTGTPTAPTPTTSDSTTKIATTAFVAAAVAAGGSGVAGTAIAPGYIWQNGSVPVNGTYYMTGYSGFPCTLTQLGVFCMGGTMTISSVQIYNHTTGTYTTCGWTALNCINSTAIGNEGLFAISTPNTVQTGDMVLFTLTNVAMTSSTPLVMINILGTRTG